MELKFLPVGGYWYVGMVALVLALIALGVRPRHLQLPFGKLLILKVLRLLAICLLLIALLRPTLILTRSTPEEGTLLVLVDRTRSMQVADSLDNRPRWEVLQSLLRDSAGDLARLQASWKVRAYSFADTLTPLPLDEQGRLTLPATPEGEQTALGFALEELLATEGDERLKGVLLLSDGAQRAVAPRDAPPQLVARQYAAEQIPLYTIPFGQPASSSRSDLAIEDLLASGTLFANAPTEIRGQLRAEGYANRPVRVQLLWENAEGEMEVVDSLQHAIVGDDSRTPLALTHTPETPGEYKVTLQVESPEGELVTTNNQASTFVTVREGGIKVLYLSGTTRLGGGPGIEQRFVRAALAASPDILVTHHQFDYRRAQLNYTQAFQPGNYDVVILDNVDKQAINANSWQALADLTRSGAGLYMGGGFHSFGPGGFLTTPLSQVLPIEIGPAENQNFNEPIRQDMHAPGPLALRPTPEIGQNHPLLQLGGETPTTEAWEALPPLDGANRFTGLKPNAQVLLESADQQRLPLLVVGQAGQGRTVAFAGDSTWRWQLEGHGDALRRFWRQVVLYLARKDGQQEGDVWIELDTRRVTRGGRIDIELGTLLPSGKQPGGLQLELSVVDPQGNRTSVSTLPAGESRHLGTYTQTDHPGDYVAEVIARVDGETIGTARARFLVPTQDLELDRPGADPALLAQLAQLTAEAGGQLLAPEELPDLVERLASTPPELKTEVTERRTFWDTWPFLLTFVAVFGAEWWLRKRWGLV